MNGISERNLITHVRTFLKGPFITRYLSMRVTYPVKFSQNTALKQERLHQSRPHSLTFGYY